MKFEYYEIRPCVRSDGEVQSFLGKPEFNDTIGDKVCTPTGALAEAEAFQKIHGGELFWTLYGSGEGRASAIGDFVSFDAALEALNAILAPMAEARDLIDTNGLRNASIELTVAGRVLDDVINQSSTAIRL
jgi:hypothetical protein